MGAYLLALLIVPAFLALLVGMAWWPKLRHRWQARIDAEHAADQACARVRNVEGGRRA